ncbi:MAG: DUF1292 domain-containing protein [Lachnospiraceae bacterium]|nr:DUF1292 domain-containing protein [Lachnospiraceae bacterium]
MEKISFSRPDEEPVEFYVLEQTRLGGINYLLVTDKEEGDAEALILKDLSSDEAVEGIYEIVSDDQELNAVAAIFEDILEDVDLVSDDSEE